MRRSIPRATWSLARVACLAAGGIFAFVAGIAACGEEPGASAPVPPKDVPPVVVDAGASAKDAGDEVLCKDGEPTVDWPRAPHAIGLTETLPPDLAWGSPEGTVFLRSFYEPCAPRSRILVLRSSAAWCGPCLWHAAHTRRLLADPRFADRVELVDLLIADRDNMYANAAAATAFKAQIDMPGKVVIDPSFTFRPVASGAVPLPEYVLVDTRTMKVLTLDSDPSPEQLASKILLTLAELDGAPRPPEIIPTRYDDVLTENEWDLVQGMKLSAAPPPDPTNEYADDPLAAAFGKLLFSDSGLGPSTVSCATCHLASKSFADGTPQSVGLARVDRNAPSISMAAHERWQFWDGRADTLWMQALGPPEDPKEMGSSRLFVAHRIAGNWAADYAAVFGAKYPLPDLSGLPAAGKPGDPAYDALPIATRDAVTRIYVNVGKAIAAFERSLRVKPNALDRYASGDRTALGIGEKEALQTFFKLGCAQCHWGPRLTDDAFHALRFPTGRVDGVADRGRIDVLGTLAGAEFVATSKWSDAPGAAKTLVFTGAAPNMVGAFKTPALRGVATTAPYGHGGMYPTLLEVSRHYATRGQLVTPAKAVGLVEVWSTSFDANAQAVLPVILQVMTAELEP